MKEVWKEYKENVYIYKENFLRFLKYQIVSKLILSIIMLPLFYWLAARLMNSKGYSYLTNGLVQKFILSPQGLLLIVLGIIFGLLLILMEIGGLTILSYQALQGQRESSYLEVLKYSISKIKYFLGVDGFFMIFYLFLIAPILGSNIKTSALTSIEIPGFVMEFITSNNLYQFYLLALLTIFVFLSVRWIFALHIVLLSDSKVKHPLRRSGKLLKSNFKYIFKYVIYVFVINALILLILLVAITLIAMLIMFFITESMYIFMFYALLIFSALVFSTLSFILLPLQMIFITRVYLSICSDKKVDITLKCKNRDSILDKLLSKRRNFVAIILILVACSCTYVYIFTLEALNTRYSVDITAHRGSSTDAPENTLASIDSAKINGATYAEIDVQMSKDGVAVILHDKSFLRTTGVDEYVWELSLSEIKELDAGSWHSEKFIGEKVPTLEEMIKYSKNKVRLNIEIKLNGNDQNIVSEVVRLIKENDLSKTCVVTSLDYKVLTEVKKLDANIKTGYIMYLAIGELEKLNVDFYSIEERNVSESFVEEAHNLGRKVHVWTINSRDSMENMMLLGVDNIITDNVKELKNLIKDQNNIMLSKESIGKKESRLIDSILKENLKLKLLIALREIGIKKHA